MRSLRDQAVVWSDRLGLPRLFGHAPEKGVTTLVFHHFRFGDETWGNARERLQWQLDLLVKRFEAVPVEALLDLSGSVGQSRSRAVVTIDDAKLEILQVADIFKQFDVPFVQFVCAGWTDQASTTDDPHTLRARLVAWLHFYEGPAETMTIDGRSFQLDKAGNAKLIDAIISASDQQVAALTAWEAKQHQTRRSRVVCNWSELRDLQADGMAIGCHSVSHPRIAQQTAMRQRFEIAVSKAIVERHLGTCRWFAYPYGTRESHSPATYAICSQLGFDAVFTTTPGITSCDHDRLQLPRISLPNTVMPRAIFEARVRGGGVPLTRIKEWLS